jgi:Zn-dependent protease
MNPCRHVDMFGTIVLPLLLFVVSAGSLLIAYAKPVEIDPDRFRKPRVGLAMVALAGPLANGVAGIVAAVVWGVVPDARVVSDGILWFAILSLSMFVINLIPLPPLDGSRVVAALLPMTVAHRYLEHGVWALAGIAAGSAALAALTPYDPLLGLLKTTVFPALRFFAGR